MILVCVDGLRKPIVLKPGMETPLGRMCTYASPESVKVSRRVGAIRSVTDGLTESAELLAEKELYVRPAGDLPWHVLKPESTRKAGAQAFMALIIASTFWKITFSVVSQLNAIT